MSDLHSTRSAALFLGVSEASVRRWSDAGVLPVLRVGRRRARRFAEEDLSNFLRDARAGAGGRMEIHSRNRGAGQIGGIRFGVHDHIATFYDSNAGRLRLTVPFLSDGLIAGDRCFLVASQPLIDEYVQVLGREHGIPVEAALRSGALVTRSGPGSSARQAVSDWENLWWQALGAGAMALRVVGEMATLKGFPSVQEMLDYEVAFDSLSKRFPVRSICQYDVREFDGLSVLQAIKAHPDIFGMHTAEFLL